MTLPHMTHPMAFVTCFLRYNPESPDDGDGVSGPRGNICEEIQSQQDFSIQETYLQPKPSGEITPSKVPTDRRSGVDGDPYGKQALATFRSRRAQKPFPLFSSSLEMSRTHYRAGKPWCRIETPKLL